MSGGFGASFLKGAFISLVGLSAVSLVAPLDPLDPGQNSQVDLETPEGSGFNAARKDTDPVLPEGEETVILEEVSKPEVEVPEPQTPLTDTAPSDQPEAASGVDLPDVEGEEDDIVLSLPQSETPIVNKPAALGVPMPEIDNPVREIPVNELPIVDAPTTELQEPPEIDENGTQTATPVVEEPVETHPKNALMRNKVVFRNTADRPLMSIILMDGGERGLDQEVLLTFSFPISFAFDPDSGEKTLKPDAFAASGFEVLALAPAGDNRLEAAESASDIETALAAVFTLVPHAVGLVDRPVAEIQQSPELAAQVIEGLHATGHGLLTYDIGLNATDQKAKARDVPAATVFRVLDADGEKSATIKRYLDRAALEAGKDGHVVVVGHTYPETVTALFSWALSAKSSTVALAPVSAVLLQK